MLLQKRQQAELQRLSELKAAKETGKKAAEGKKGGGGLSKVGTPLPYLPYLLAYVRA